MWQNLDWTLFDSVHSQLKSDARAKKFRSKTSVGCVLWGISPPSMIQWFNASCWTSLLDLLPPPFTALKLPIYKTVIEIRQLIYLVIVFFMPPDRFSNWLPGAFLPRPAGSGWHGVRKFIPRSGFLPHIILQHWFQKKQAHIQNIAKGTTDPRVEFISQDQTQILIKFHLQNLEQASTSKS